jgi:predicted transcriptional regulator YdeE
MAQPGRIRSRPAASQHRLEHRRYRLRGPVLTYARFVHKGPRSELELTRGHIYHTRLPQSDLRLSLPLEIEYHGRGPASQDHEDSQWQIVIPIQNGLLTDLPR